MDWDIEDISELFRATEARVYSLPVVECLQIILPMFTYGDYIIPDPRES